MRSHHCNELRESHIDLTVTLIGWVNSARDHGGVIFIDLRDREGLTQCVFHPDENPEVSALSHTLREEDVVQVTGRVSKRLDGSENSKIGTGAIEIVATGLSIVNKADVLPFQLDKELSNEDMRMKYRYLDLRRAAHEQEHPPAQRDHLRRPQLSRRLRFLRNRDTHPVEPDTGRCPRFPRAVAPQSRPLSTRFRRLRSSISSF